MNVCGRPLTIRARKPQGYKKEHHRLCIELDTPCYICGVRNSQGGAMETHHWHLEWSLMNAANPKKVAQDVPDVPVNDWKAFCEWVDHSPENLLVLCAEHHRFGFTGIHAITYPIWIAQRYVEADITGPAPPPPVTLPPDLRIGN